MKRNTPKQLAFLLAVLLLLSSVLTACSGGGESSAAPDSEAPADTAPSADTAAEEPEAGGEEMAAGGEEGKLVIWQAACTGAIELEKPEEEWVFSKMCRQFEADHPGVTIESVYERDQQLLQNKLKAAVLANNAPDIANIYSGYLVSTLSEIFIDITEYIPAKDLEEITGWEALSKDLVMGNPIYGYPTAGAEMGLLIYNKQLTDQAGVDLEGDGQPKNAEEFMDALRQIQAAGIQPLIGRDEGWNPAYMFSFGSWWTQQVGIERVTSNSLGVTKFADDTAFIESLDLVAQMYAEGLINKDYSSNPDPFGQFLSGQAAMYMTGNWDLQTAVDALGVENTGMYVVPDYREGVMYPGGTIGGVGQAMCVVSTCKEPELAVEFLSFFSNKENVLALSKILSKIPQRVDITPEDAGWAGVPVFEKLLQIASVNLMPWNDNSMQSDVMNEYYVQTGLAVIGTITAQECAEALDAKAAEVN